METRIAFQKFPKIARLNRDCIITEKIDGTNAQVFIEDTKLCTDLPDPIAEADGMGMWAGSRKRWITPEQDNYAFASWCVENAEGLFKLGPGRHFGEWWGQGVQRRYGMHKKVFSLFNVSRWLHDRPVCTDVVPLLYEGPFHSKAIKQTLESLREGGSAAARKYQVEFDNPEGIVVFHKHGNYLFKVTLENDEVPKSLVKGA